MLDRAKTMDNNIVSWITGKADLQQVPLPELKEITHKYPYFTLAQLLLTVKMKTENDPEYPHQLQKTALNFQNPQWLHFQLESLELSLYQNKQQEEKPPATNESVPETPATDFSGNIREKTTDSASESISAQETTINAPQAGTVMLDAPTEEKEEDIADLQTSSNQADTAVEEIPEQTSIPENTGHREGAVENEDNTDKQEDVPESTSRLSAMIEAQAVAFKSADVSQESLAFDHPKLLPTKDYFASIGIFTDNAANSDFGQKVKRFSDWLKQMKRIGDAGMEKQSDPNEDRIVMQKAYESNKASSVVTETMVDVLVQQGKKQEAIGILEKLSLLKPEKSSYFASLINRIKNNN